MVRKKWIACILKCLCIVFYEINIAWCLVLWVSKKATLIMASHKCWAKTMLLIASSLSSKERR